MCECGWSTGRGRREVWPPRRRRRREGGGLVLTSARGALAGVHAGTRRCRPGRSGGSHRSHDAGSGVSERGRHPVERARQTAGSRTTPLPRDTTARPASNWGLTRSTRSASAADRPAQRRHDAEQRDERQVGHHERAGLERRVGRPQHRRGQGAHVDPFEHASPGDPRAAAGRAGRGRRRPRRRGRRPAGGGSR